MGWAGDGYALNPGDLSWRAFDQLGELLYYDRTSPDLAGERCSVADAIITNKTTINEETIHGAPHLKVIAVTATGYNVVDTQVARSRGIPVCNVPEYGTDSVAQHAFALLLELANQVGRHARGVSEGEWQQSIDWCFTRTPLIELSGKTLGLIGFGRIGQQVARIARAFGMQLIHEADLAEALRTGVLAGAALDVLAMEPPPAGHPLIGLSNCLITPHNAWMSREARQRIMQTTFENVKAALAGKPQNVVNG